MGFIDFLKNAGSEIFGKKGGQESEDDAIKGLVTEALKGKVEDLSVQYEDGTVTLGGRADSQATREKAILIAGNVKGVERVDGDAVQIPAEPTSAPAQYYTVEKGDNLSQIAKKQYGDPGKYTVIFEANREVIKDPDLIYPGQKLRIPAQAGLSA